MNALHFLFVLCATLQHHVDGKSDDMTEVNVNSIWKPTICTRKVDSGDFVRYHYYGTLTDGTYFDSSYEKGEAYATYVGSGWLIDGMDQGLLGMCVNEHRLITIPPQLAYGEEGTDDIPGNSILLFNVVMLDVWNDNDTIKVTTTYMPTNCERKLEVSDYIRYHYNGTLLNGKKFHSSYDDESTFNTYVGQGWLIKGMDQGLLGVCMGERRTIVIPPHLAYGEKGDGKNIPRSATVIFDVEVVDFHNPKDDVDVKITKPVEDCPRKIVDSDFVRYDYNGTLADGTVFDSSYKRHHTYDTYIGFKRIIPGMERGLLGACMGEWRSITFPPHLGYGERGIENKIPGSAVLTFHVHVVDFHNPKDDVKIEVVHLPDACIEKDARKAEKGDYLTYDYNLKLMDGTEIESSKDRTGTWGSYIGRGNLILGVERGLIGMCEGEIRRVIVPPHIGYGEPGKEGLIPGSAVLDFTFEVHKIEHSLPDGYQFMWVDEEKAPATEDEAFQEIDEDQDKLISLPEFTSFILNQVEKGYARLLPGEPKEDVILDLFQIQDKDKNEFLSVKEFSLKIENDPLGFKAGDEL